MKEAQTKATPQADRRQSQALEVYGQRYRSELLEEGLHGVGAFGVALARRHAAIADELVVTIFEQAHEVCREIPVLLGAVGGYGRGLLGLGSDLDLCFVTNESPEAIAPCVQAMLYPLWDAGVQVGHQIVRPSDVAREVAGDLALATELLDFRALSGDWSLGDALGKSLRESTFSDRQIGAFIAQLESSAANRHHKFGDSVYLLEPDLKNGRGGLRDLDSALWAARARFGTAQLAELADLNVISAQGRQDAQRALDFLWTVRNHLHRLSGRKADRLTFVHQERVAEVMGYGRGEEAGVPRLRRIGEMVEAFMSEYYRHARTIAHTRDRIMGRAKRSPSARNVSVHNIGKGFVECDGRLGLERPEYVKSSPELAFRVYAMAVAMEKPLLARTRDAIAAAMEEPGVGRRLRQSKLASDIFVTLVCSSRPSPFGSGSILTELHDVGLLVAMIPEFSPVVGRVHHDLYHVYTVDVHSIAAVDRLHSLVRGKWATQYPLACRLAAETARPRVLYMATLLHDVGKAIGGRNHPQRGADMSRGILKRLGYSQDEIEDVCRLIVHHLTMYMVATRRDLNDPRTTQEFVKNTWDRESLRELFLLTMADVCTTSPKAMNTWKLGMLTALYRSSDAHLSGQLPGPTCRIEQLKEKVRSAWSDPWAQDDLERFLDSMPERYFLANSPEAVAVHARLASGCRGESVAVSWIPSSHEGIMGLCVVAGSKQDVDLCVVADDRPGLLASIAAAISASHFEIQAAQVNTRALSGGGYQALDLFWVRSPNGDAAKERRLERLKEHLQAVVGGEVEPEALMRPRAAESSIARRGPAVVTEVLFDHHASEQYTVIEVLAEDRPTLLFLLSSALQELGIEVGVAKISTEGTRAVDVLYASERDGSKIAPGQRTEEVREKLLSTLDAG